MIEILSKAADEIDISDIESLISSETPEGEGIEFKRSIPAKGRKPDPWIAGEDRIGDHGRNAILEETVAFANAHGGALLLGVEESGSKPSVAAQLSPVPRCAELAERLKLVFRDCVDPQLPVLEVFSVPTGNGYGIVVLRVGRSRLAPHRVEPTRVCPIRRSDRCEVMSMREIQDLTLNLSRGLERLEQRFEERARLFRQEFDCLRTPRDAWGIRLTAAPVGDEIRINRIFHRGSIVESFDEPWHGVRFRQNDVDHRLAGPTTLIPNAWKPRLRATRAEREYEAESKRAGIERNFYRELHSDGLIEIGCVSSRINSGTEEPWRLPADFPVDMFANLAVWADRVRKQAGAPASEYALEIQFFSEGGEAQIWVHDRHLPQHIVFGDVRMLPPGSKCFPRYPLGDSASILDILSLFFRDFRNFLGQDVESEKEMFTIENWSV